MPDRSPASALETPRLALRPSAASDLDRVHALWTDPHVRHFLFDDRVLSREEAASHLRTSVESFGRRGYGLWLVCERGSPAIVGFTGLLHQEEAAPQLLYGFRREHCGRGYATEAARAVLGHAFRRLALPRVAADVDEPNVASVRVLEKLGMTPTGRRFEEGRPLLDFERLADAP